MKNETILIVDDDPDILHLLAEVLSRAGYAVAQADDATSAEVAFAFFEPAVAVLDLKLPRSEGLDLARRFQSLRSNAKIIVMTGWVTPEIETEAIELGLQVLAKPFLPDALLARISAELATH